LYTRKSGIGIKGMAKIINPIISVHFGYNVRLYLDDNGSYPTTENTRMNCKIDSENTVKSSQTVTSNTKSPVFKGHLFLSCHRKFHIN
jgi:hypothetical protein